MSVNDAKQAVRGALGGLASPFQVIAPESVLRNKGLKILSERRTPIFMSLVSAPYDIGFSGGVDSSLILVKLLQRLQQSDRAVIAHTIGWGDALPDIVHARRFVAFLQSTFPRLQTLPRLSHKVSIMSPTEDDQVNSNRITNSDSPRADNYYMLMRAVSPYTNSLVGCDCIDEFAGGYYPHRDPQKLSSYDPTLSMDDNRLRALEHFRSLLTPNHLVVAQANSAAFDIKMVFPYGTAEVMECMSRFSLSELIDDENRKKPIYAIARRNGVSQDVLSRRKYGLVSAFVR